MFIVTVSDGKCKGACLYAVGLGFCGDADHHKSHSKHVVVVKDNARTTHEPIVLTNVDRGAIGITL